MQRDELTPKEQRRLEVLEQVRSGRFVWRQKRTKPTHRGMMDHDSGNCNQVWY